MHARRIAVLLLVAVGLIAIPLVARSRTIDPTTQERSVGDFDAVHINGIFVTEISAGRLRTSVTITAPSDIIGDITTRVEGGTLFVGMKSEVHHFFTSPHVRIGMPTLRGFTNEGTGSARISGLTGGDIDIVNTGTGSIRASGRAARETITLNGVGKIDTTEVAARDVTVDNNGVGSIDVRASETLRMNVNGIGAIRYTGNPTSVDRHVNGLGRIDRLS